MYDADDPLAATPLALARAADGTAAVVAVDRGRGDAAPVVPPAARWVTWVTRPAVPPHAEAGPQDRVVLADPAWRPLAEQAGWPAERVSIGRCPSRPPRPSPPWPPTLSLICDTARVDPPDAVRQFSSHRLLWESILADLSDNPLRLTNPGRHVCERATQGGVPSDGLDVPLFVDGLVLPAYAQGLARLLIAAGLPVRLWGSGWEEIGEFGHFAAGPLTTAEALGRALDGSTAVVRHLPGTDWHPVEACGQPVLTAGDPRTWISRAKVLLSRPATPRLQAIGPDLSAGLATAMA